MNISPKKLVRRRQITYAVAFSALFFGYLYLRDSTWQGDTQFHTVMETVATVLALTVGCLALVRFYRRKENTFLLIGAGFIVTAFLDGYHAIVTSSHFTADFPSTSLSLTTWSWFASRIFLSVLLWLSWVLWKREERLGGSGRISEYPIYAILSSLALVAFLFFRIVPLPPVYHPGLVFPRPQEFVPALFFLFALIGYLRKGKWRTDPFEHWLVLSLIVGFMGQAMFMSLSGRVYDMMFDTAHVLKVGSYICILVGLLANLIHVFSESISRQEMEFKNTVLESQRESSPNGILVVDANGRIIFCNRQFAQLWGLPQQLVDKGVDEPVLQTGAAAVADGDAFLDRVRYLYEHKKEKSHDEILLKNGTILDRYTAPMFGPDGTYYGRMWDFRDITEEKRRERELRESEAKFRGLVESTTDWIWVVNEYGVYTYASPQVRDLLGYEPEEVLGKTPYDFLAPSEVKRVADLLTPIVTGQLPFKLLESVHLHKDGREVIVETSGTPFFDEAGVFRGHRGIDHDVTARKRTEAELQRKTAFLEALAGSAIDGFLVVDPEGKKIFQNERTIELWKIPREVADNPDDKQQIAHVMNATVDPKQFVDKIVYLYDHPSETTRDEVALKDSTILDRYSLPVIGADGRNYGRVWSFRDITEEKRHDRELRESEEKFHSLVEQSLVGISIVQDGKTIYVNPKFAEIFGYSMDEIMSLGPLDTTIEADRPLLAENMHKGISGELKSMRFTYRGLRKDRSVVDIEVHGSTTVIDGKQAIIGVLLDVTERTRAEREVQVLQEQLREQATRDPLTGLYNRRYLDETIGRELARAKRYSQPVSLVMCDIDHFKAVNDAHGHLVGDEVLRVFADLLKRNARGSDIICRYGGEEFLLVFPDMPQEVACQRAERLRLAFVETLVTSGSSVVKTTASFGVAAFPEHGTTEDELIAVADKAMYAAKEGGRNQVRRYDTAMESHLSDSKTPAVVHA